MGLLQTCLHHSPPETALNTHSLPSGHAVVALNHPLLSVLGGKIEQILYERIYKFDVLVFSLSDSGYSFEHCTADPFEVVIYLCLKKESLLVPDDVLQDYFRVDKEV